MIQSGLPARTTIKTAPKSDLLLALCRAVKEHPDAAAALTSMGVAARKELAGEMVATVLRCSGKNDCEFVGTIVAAAVAAAAEVSGSVGQTALARAPACGDTIRRAVQPVATRAKGTGATPAAESGEATGSLGGNGDANEEFDPLEPLRLVCDNGVQRALRESLVADFLETHPGAFVGTCPPAAPSPAASTAPPSTPKPNAPR